MRQWKLIAVLFAVLLALGGLATWDEWKTKQEKAEEETKNKLADFKVEDVTEVEYFSRAQASDDASTDGEKKPEANAEPKAPVSATLKKVDGTWRLTKPIEALADQGAVTNLLTSIKDYSFSKVVAESKDKWGEFGLTDPERVVTIRTGGDKPTEYTILLGNKAPVGFSVYLRTNKGDQVYMGSQHLLTSTAKSLFELRDKTIVKIDESKIKSLVYERKGEKPIELVKTEGRYAITKPQALPAATDEVKDLVDEINSARAQSFDDAPAADVVKAFTTPTYAVTWKTDVGDGATLKVVEHGGKLLGAFDPSQHVFGLSSEVEAKLKKDLTSFRNRRILSVDDTDARELEPVQIDVDGEVYKNVAGNWFKAADADKLDDQGKPKPDVKEPPQEVSHIRAFAVDLEFAKTDTFISLDDPAAKGLQAAPTNRVTVAFKDPAKHPPVTLELFPAPGADDKYLVRKTNGEYVYRVPKTAFASMKPGAAPPPSDGGADPEMPADEGLNFEDQGSATDEKEPTG